jgi:PAS domain-containing protein
MDLVHTEFYNDWMRPSRLGTVSYGGFALRRNGFDELTLGVLHDRSVEDYSEEDMNLGRALMPCLRSCFLLRERLVSRLDQSESRSGDVGECSPDLAATAVLDRMSYGAVVLNARGFIQYANGAAEDAFRRGVPLRKVGRRVIVCGSARGDRFDRLVASVLDHPAASRGGAVAWVDEDGSSRMLLIVLPFGGSAGGDLQSVLVLLLPALERRTAPELILRDAWGLTPREALLCQAMASHRNVEVAAEMVEISYAHALVRLKTIRSKLSVTSNGELIELISTLGRLRWD